MQGAQLPPGDRKEAWKQGWRRKCPWGEGKGTKKMQGTLINFVGMTKNDEP